MMNFHNIENIKQVSAKTFTKFLVARSETDNQKEHEESLQSLRSDDSARIPVS